MSLVVIVAEYINSHGLRDDSVDVGEQKWVGIRCGAAWVRAKRAPQSYGRVVIGDRMGGA